VLAALGSSPVAEGADGRGGGQGGHHDGLAALGLRQGGLWQGGLQLGGLQLGERVMKKEGGGGGMAQAPQTLVPTQKSDPHKTPTHHTHHTTHHNVLLLTPSEHVFYPGHISPWEASVPLKLCTDVGLEGGSCCLQHIAPAERVRVRGVSA
jgi:hypothetical protein